MRLQAEKRPISSFEEAELLTFSLGTFVRQTLPLTGIELGGFFSKMEGNRFPKVHHSKAYKAAYHPAYRVIVRGFLLW